MYLLVRVRLNAAKPPRTNQQVAGLGEALRCAGHAVDQLSVLAGKGVEQSQVLFEDVIVDWHRAVLAVKAALQKRLEVRGLLAWCWVVC